MSEIFSQVFENKNVFVRHANCTLGRQGRSQLWRKGLEAMVIDWCRPGALSSIAMALVMAGSLAWGSAAQAGPAACQTAANLVMNCGFEDTTPLNQWNANGGATIDSAFPHSGVQDAAIGGDPSSPGTLEQTLTTSPGQEYTLDFWVLDEQGDPLDTFEVTFGGFDSNNDFPNPPITGDQAMAYTHFTFDIPGSDITNNSTDLLFNASNYFYSLGDQAPWNLDDVSVDPVTTTVPEPTSIALLGVALTGFGCFRRRKRDTDQK